MSRLYTAVGLVLFGVLFGVIGLQYNTINKIEAKIEAKVQENAHLRQTNAQFKQNQLEISDRIRQTKKMLDKERSLTAKRELEFSRNNNGLSIKLSQLEKEKSNDWKEASLLRSRLPSSTIRLLSGTDKTSQTGDGR